MSSRKYIPSPGGILPNGLVYEQIEAGSNVQYAVKTNKGISIEPFLASSEYIVYQPVAPSPWILPPAPIDYENMEKLWAEIKKFVYDHLDLENEDLYDVYVAWVVSTWVTEQFDSTGYLHFNGPRNSGKTRALNILNYLCFRPILSSSVTGPTVFRAIDAFKPTFLLDEFEMYENLKEAKAEVIGVINSGYTRGQVALRMMGMKEGTPIVKGFTLFGPKALSSIEPLPHALESRCIRFPMTRTFRKIRRLIDKEGARQIRGKLLKFRLDSELDEPTNGSDNPIDLPDGRLIEIYYPLESVAPTQIIKDRILDNARNQYNMSIQEERATIEAYVFHTILDTLKENPRLTIPQSELRERYSREYFGGQEIKYQTMGGWLKRMGFESKWDGKIRATVFITDVDKLESRKNRYVLSEEMEEINSILDMVRRLKDTQLKLSFATESTESTDMGMSGGTANRQKTETIKTVITDNSVNTVDSVETVDPVELINASLKDKMDWVFGELSCTQDGATAGELAEKSGMPLNEMERLLTHMGKSGDIFQPRPGVWKTA